MRKIIVPLFALILFSTLSFMAPAPAPAAKFVEVCLIDSLPATQADTVLLNDEWRRGAAGQITLLVFAESILEGGTDPGWTVYTVVNGSEIPIYHYEPGGTATVSAKTYANGSTTRHYSAIFSIPPGLVAGELSNVSYGGPIYWRYAPGAATGGHLRLWVYKRIIE